MALRKTLVWMVAILIITAMVPVWASSGAAAEPGEESYDSLKLTDTQKEQIKPIIEDRAQQINQVMHDTSLTPQEKWAKTDEIRAQSRTAVDQYLTPEQKSAADPVRSENDVMRNKVRTEQEKVIADNQKLKEDRKQLRTDRKNGDKEAVEDDRDKVKEDRQQRSNDRQDRHQVRQQNKEDRRERRQK
jgi:hypothetical protein